MKRRKTGDPQGRPSSGTTSPAPFHAPFARLAERLGVEPAGTLTAPDAPPTAPPAGSATAPLAAPARAVVRVERKGRGGKEATVVEKMALGPHERDAWLKQLKQALGCGGTVEGEALVLQGDLRLRVKALLEARGVRKVTLG